MKTWIAGIVGVALAAGLAGAKPPQEFEVNVTYCINQQLQAQNTVAHQQSVGRLRKDCERLVEGLDSQFRHERAYMRASIEQRREILSDAIDCRVRFSGRPGTGYQDCVRQALDAFAPSEPGQ